MSLVTYYDPQTDHHLIAVVLVEQELMLVLHEDTLARYEVRPWEPARYQPRKWPWPDVTPRDKLLLWGERIEARLQAGLAAQMAEREGDLSPFEQYLILLGLFGIAAKTPALVKLVYAEALATVGVFLGQQIEGPDARFKGGVDSVEEVMALMGKFYERLAKK